jgi:hypothetical protein
MESPENRPVDEIESGLESIEIRPLDKIETTGQNPNGAS